MKRLWCVLAGLAVVGQLNGAVLTADFDDLGLAEGSYWNGSDLSGGFVSSLMFFGNSFNTNYGSWNGFAYSSVSDTNTAGWANQYAVWTPGSDVSGEGSYAVGYDSAWDEQDVITLPYATKVRGFYINNTTYAALSMINGDSYAKKFGGSSGDDPDWFKVTISGCDAASNVVGSTEFYLADYRFADNTQDYVVSNWTWVDLSGLGSNVKSLHFALSSSDVGAWGMNTPAYFVMDNLVISKPVNDFDGDGVSDDVEYYAPEGRWSITGSNGSPTEVQFGFAGTVAAPADYDGDGITDLCVYHAPSGMWYMFKSRDGYSETQFGFAGTVAATGDYDGDGVDDICVYYAPSGMWYMFKSRDGYCETQFGFAGTEAAPGDYDGDGITDLCVYHAPSGMWYMFKSRDGYSETQFGYAGTVPDVGDFDGDGITDIGCYDKASGKRYRFCSHDGFSSL